MPPMKNDNQGERVQTEAKLADESITHLESLMRQAVKDGVAEVLTDRATIDAFWSAAFDVMQRRATVQTGKFVLGGVRAAAHRAAWFVALGLVVYSLGGWTAVSKLIHSAWGAD